MDKYVKIPPYKHQLEAFIRSKDARYFGLFMEQGTGKTYVSLANVEYLYRHGNTNAVVVLAPSGVQINWAREEIPKHLPSFPENCTLVTWNSYATQKQTNMMWYSIANCPKDKLLIIVANIEALRLERFRDVLGTILKARRVMTIIDESTIIKSHDAQQSKLAMGVGLGSSYRRILTGTPITQGPLDLWGQLRFLLPKDRMPCPSFTAFKAKYAIEKHIPTGPGRGFTKILGYRDLDQLTEFIKPFTFRVTKEECLDLPDKVYTTRNIQLTQDQRRVYNEILYSSLSIIPDGVITSTIAITTMLRLCQIVVGHVKTDDGKVSAINSNRPAAFKTLFDDMQGKAIVFCRFRHDIETLAETLKNPELYAFYHGDVDESGRQESLKRFKTDPNCRILLATRSASRGLTLTEAKTVIYYSQGWSLEDRLQSEDRAHRIGQDQKVLYVDFVALGTVEEKIIKALKSKKELADQILTKKDLLESLQLGD